MKKKLRVGWFSFSCCEDSTIIFTELLNDYWENWKDKIEIVNALILQKRSTLKDLDISFDEATNEEIKNLLIRFIYADKVKRVKDVVTIDAEVNGCPMVEQMFLKVLNGL